MSPLTPEELDDLRSEMASLAISDASKDELIHIIDNVVISFVDQAHGVHSVQLSLSARANKQFQNTDKSGNRKDTPNHEIELSDPVGSPGDSNLDRRLEP